MFVVCLEMCVCVFPVLQHKPFYCYYLYSVWASAVHRCPLTLFGATSALSLYSLFFFKCHTHLRGLVNVSSPVNNFWPTQTLSFVMSSAAADAAGRTICLLFKGIIVILCYLFLFFISHCCLISLSLCLGLGEIFFNISSLSPLSFVGCHNLM